jgi:hypothetical protein
MTWTAAVMSDDHLDPDSLVGRMLRCDDVPPVFPDDGSSLPVLAEDVLSAEPLPLWLVMARAEAKERGSDAYLPLNFSSRCIKAWAPVIEALADWLLPDSDALAIDELAAAQQHLRHALEWQRARLTEQARIARGEP